MTDAEIHDTERPLGVGDGQSLPEAIREKYLTDEPLSGMILGGVAVVSKLPSKKDPSSGKLRLPPCLALNYCCIVGAGDIREVETLCNEVKELDLAENKLSEWNEVFFITSQIPQLTFLNLSSNPLGSSSIPPELTPITSLGTITSLVLNNTRIPWETLHCLLDSTPALEKLHISLNDYDTIRPADRTYPSVKLLQFNRNQITNWADASKLGRMFPNLELFFVAENNLTGLTDAIGEHFKRLKNLCVRETGIASWEEIDALNSFPALTEVRMSSIPLLEGYSQKERHHLTVARLGRVTHLNGSRIADSEREEAERAFIRYYMNRDNKPQRYYDLVAVHGSLKPLIDVDLRPKTRVTCKVHFEDKVETFVINVKQTCTQLKQSLQDFVGLPLSKFHIYHLDPENEFGLDKMRYPSKFLYSYQVRDGDEFFIYRKA